MELSYITEFLVLVETRFFSKAARQLSISSSALTRHIQVLEKELGKPLFDRTSQRVELTDFGKAFFPYARQFASVQKECMANLVISTRREEQLRVCSTIPLAPYIPGKWIVDFKSQYPEIPIAYEHILPERSLDLLREDHFDFLVAYSDGVPKNEFQVIPCDQDPVALLVSSSHPLAGREKVILEELSGEKVALSPNLAADSSPFMQKYKEMGSYVDFIAVNSDIIIDLAVVGYCPVIMPKRLLTFPGTNNAFSVIDIDPMVENTIAVVYRKEPPLSKLEQCFLSHLQGYLQ